MSQPPHQTLSIRLEQLYNHYRKALMNRKYYGYRLHAMERWNLSLEILLAVGTSSAVGGWLIWKTQFGEYLWAIITGAAAVLAIIKPILKLSKKIGKYSKLFIGHGEVFYSLQGIAENVRIERHFTPELENKYGDTLERFNKLAAEDDPKPKNKLLKACQKEVNREISPQNLWMPK